MYCVLDDIGGQSTTEKIETIFNKIQFKNKKKDKDNSSFSPLSTYKESRKQEEEGYKGFSLRGKGKQKEDSQSYSPLSNYGDEGYGFVLGVKEKRKEE